MRKRAKTQEEKEERAQERVMRNRAAAQISRERKREHMATLEVENQGLCDKIQSLSTENSTLRGNIQSLTQRLETMEKMFAYFTAPDAPPETAGEVSSGSPVLPEQLCYPTPPPLPQQLCYPAPPGTIRPQDLMSLASTNILASFDSRNPAVIAYGPQRRISKRFPWNLSSRSPIYQQMESILSFWTTILRVTTSQAFTTQTLTYLTSRCTPSKRLSLHRAADHWRFSATGSVPRASEHESGVSIVTGWDLAVESGDLGREEHGFSGKGMPRDMS